MQTNSPQEHWSMTANWRPISDRYQEQVAFYEALSKQWADTSNQWLSALAGGVGSTPGLPKTVNAAVRATQGGAESALQLQRQLWESWFQWLKILPGLPAATVSGSLQSLASAEPEITTVEAVTEAAASALTAEEVAATVIAEPKQASTPATTIAVEDTAAPVTQEPDDLTAIAGIGPALADKLTAVGVNKYSQIAAWSEEDIEHIETKVLEGHFRGRIQRDSWIEQARALTR